MADESTTRERFTELYTGPRRPPWDVDGPQPAFVATAGAVAGSVLDAGCGTGENALFFAERGHRVTGIDFLAGPIEAARRKAAERGLAATFLVHDALELAKLSERFGNAIDSGLFHSFSDEDRRRYTAGLHAVLRPGGYLFLLCFSEAEPGTDGPRRVSRPEIQAAFASGWGIESFTATRFQVRPDVEGMKFSPGGPHAWFTIIRRE
jgi:SAM-dependent methyltransferase